MTEKQPGNTIAIGKRLRLTDGSIVEIDRIETIVAQQHWRVYGFVVDTHEPWETEINLQHQH